MENDAKGVCGSLCRGCLFCRSGTEMEAARSIQSLYPGVETLVPMKTRYRRSGGLAKEEQVVLLPGYVFFEAAEDFSPYLIRRSSSVYRLLTYDDGDWRLHGADDLFARMLFKAKGPIGLSKAWYGEGDRIRILDGFLKEYEGDIVRVNRRAKTAQVSIPFQDKRVTMWLGFELIEKADLNDDR